MIHIRIVSSPKDRFAAGLLALRLKWFYFRNKKLGPAIIRKDGPLYAGGPECQNYLIVLCSFHTVRNSDIEGAIAAFCEKEPVSHILCYTISGTPYAKDPEDDCLPRTLDTLSRHDLFAINSVELGKGAALRKIIASIHLIPLAQLEKRSKKQLRQHFLVLALLCLAFAGYSFWSDYTTTSHTEYYESFVYRNGIPVGIGKLNAAALAGRSDYYIFSMHEQLPVSLQRIGNPVGSQSPDPEIQAFYDAIDSSYIAFSYHTDDTLDAAVHADSEGFILFVMNYSAGHTIADFSEYPDGWTPYYLTLKGEKTDFSRCLFTYDPEGNLSQIQYYYNSRNLP